MSVLGWVLMYTLGCPPSQLLATKDGMGRNPVVRTYKISWWWLSLGRGTSQGILQKSVLLYANPFKDENGRIKIYFTYLSIKDEPLPFSSFFLKSHLTTKLCLFVESVWRKPPSLWGGWLVQPRWQWPLFPVWEHSEVKWWRKQKSQRFSGGKPKGWRVGENGWENGDSKSCF